MAEFPVTDEAIKALRIKVLQALASAPYPKEAIGPIAAGHSLVVDDVRALVAAYGYPNRAEMARHVIELTAGEPVVMPAALPELGRRAFDAIVQEPGNRGGSPLDLRVETLLNAASKSEKARTRRLGTKIHELVAELRGFINTETADRAAAEKAEAERSRLREEVTLLERQLAAKKALLTGKPKAAAVHRRAAAEAGLSPKEIRAWAATNDIECPAMGRVPQSVVEAYAEAHSE